MVLEADGDDAGEDQGYAEPLGAFHGFAEEEAGEEDGDGAVERGEDADDGDVAGDHAGVVGYEGGGVHQAGDEQEPPDFAARQRERAARGKTDESEHAESGQADDPDREAAADERDDVEAEPPEQDAVTERGDDGERRAFGDVRVGVVRGGVDGVRFVRRAADGGENHPDEGEREAGGAQGVDAFAAEERESDGESRIGGRDGAGDADQAHFEGAVEAEAGDGVDQAGDDGESPRMPAGSDGAMESAGEPEKEAERGGTEELHDHQRAEGADAA